MATQDIEAIVIGGSAGALDALGAILPAFPAGFGVPIAVVLHLPPTKASHLVEVLAAKCALEVSEPDDKEPLAPGHVYVAPPNYHLLIEQRRVFSLSVDGLVHFSRPSIDVLFESAAEAYGPGLVGVLLTGANEDGAQGLASIKKAKGATIVQSPDTAPVPTMPRAGLHLDPTALVLPLPEIGPYLARRALAKEAG
jgi:two-component system, chemotaxis family, protein-glutamate methylesterase/glutaminase